MKAKFERTANSTFLIVEESAEREVNYEGKMHLHNEIPGLLRSSILVINGIREYLYDITGLQSLAFMCEQGILDFETLKMVIDTLAGMPKEMERHLLKMERVVYLPEYIFLDYFHGRARYVCDLRKEMGEHLGTMEELFAYLLTKIDHKDKEMVAYMYELYEASVQKGFSLTEWAENYYERQKEKRTEQPLVFVTKAETIPEEKVVMEQPLENDGNETDMVEEVSVIRRLLGKLRRRKEGQQPKDEEKEYFYDGKGEVLPTSEETVVLSQTSNPEAFMQPVKYGEQPIHLHMESNMIGKDERADVVLKDSSVSRIHAMIKYNPENESYTLEDLNSRNGTYYNGAALEWKQQKSLKDGDLIRFGKVEYTFYECRKGA